MPGLRFAIAACAGRCPAYSGGIYSAAFFAGAFLAGAFFAGAFLAGAFFAGACVAGLAADFFTAAFEIGECGRTLPWLPA